MYRIHIFLAESGIGGNGVERANVKAGQIAVVGCPDDLVPALDSNFGIDN